MKFDLLKEYYNEEYTKIDQLNDQELKDFLVKGNVVYETDKFNRNTAIRLYLERLYYNEISEKYKKINQVFYDYLNKKLEEKGIKDRIYSTLSFTCFDDDKYGFPVNNLDKVPYKGKVVLFREDLYQDDYDTTNEIMVHKSDVLESPTWLTIMYELYLMLEKMEKRLKESVDENDDDPILPYHDIRLETTIGKKEKDVTNVELIIGT